MPGTASLTLPGTMPDPLPDEAQRGQSLAVYLRTRVRLLGSHHKQHVSPKRVHSPAKAVGLISWELGKEVLRLSKSPVRKVLGTCSSLVAPFISRQH